MTDETKPESEWQHSHALSEGDELTDTNTGAEITVVTVHDDGYITGRIWAGERGGQEYTHERWSEREVATALRDGIFEREDGKSTELASF